PRAPRRPSRHPAPQEDPVPASLDLVSLPRTDALRFTAGRTDRDRVRGRRGLVATQPLEARGRRAPPSDPRRPRAPLRSRTVRPPATFSGKVSVTPAPRRGWK